MKMKNILIEIGEQNLSSFPNNNTELRRISWFVENLKIVRIGSFLNNLDEVAMAKSTS